MPRQLQRYVLAANLICRPELDCVAQKSRRQIDGSTTTFCYRVAAVLTRSERKIRCGNATLHLCFKRCTIRDRAMDIGLRKIHMALTQEERCPGACSDNHRITNNATTLRIDATHLAIGLFQRMHCAIFDNNGTVCLCRHCQERCGMRWFSATVALGREPTKPFFGRAARHYPVSLIRPQKFAMNTERYCMLLPLTPPFQLILFVSQEGDACGTKTWVTTEFRSQGRPDFEA